MLNKIFDFIVSVVFNGFIAFLITYVVSFVVQLAMFPVSVVAGKQIADCGSVFFSDQGYGFRIIYAIIFLSMVMDDLGIKNLKTACKQWYQKSQKKTC